MRRHIIYITIILLNINSLNSQNNNYVRVSNVTFSDEELQFSGNDSVGSVVINQGLFKVNYRYLFFTIEISNLDLSNNSISFFVCFSTSNDTVPLVFCDSVHFADTSNILHAYCNVSERMIPGGRGFLLEDVKFGYRNLKDTLYRDLALFYKINGNSELYSTVLPPLSIVSPIIIDDSSSDIPYVFHKTFCPFDYYPLFGDEYEKTVTQDILFFEDEEAGMIESSLDSTSLSKRPLIIRYDSNGEIEYSSFRYCYKDVEYDFQSVYSNCSNEKPVVISLTIYQCDDSHQCVAKYFINRKGHLKRHNCDKKTNALYAQKLFRIYKKKILYVE